MMKKCALLVALAAATAMAQPVITSLGTGAPGSVTANLSGTVYAAGGIGGRWTLNAGVLTFEAIPGAMSGSTISADGRYVFATVLNDSPQWFGNSATGVSPAFSMTPTLVPAAIAVTERRPAIWDFTNSTMQNFPAPPANPTLLTFGPSSSGGSSGNIMSTNAMSPNGRYAGGHTYISTYNNAAGATISANSFQWRPHLWDAQTSTWTILPTPFRTSSNTWRRRSGTVYGVSNDGLVICGYQEHNTSVGLSADPDGARPVVWTWDSGSSSYVMSFLPNGTDVNGFPYTASASIGTMHMNADGTIILGNAIDGTGNSFIGKWVWNSGTNSWDAPVSLGSNLVTEASWLPVAVTSCAIPPRLSVTDFSDDGSVVVGIATYSTCGSFMAGGWIWTSETGIVDWYDTMAASGAVGIVDNYGPIGDAGNPARGLAKLGFPSGISPDGNNVVGFQGGNQLIPGAAPWIVQMTGGVPCSAPAITNNPTAEINYSACSSSIILNVSASGTLPITYQWFKDGVAVTDGTTPHGSVITGATTFQMRINPPLSPLDVGTYYAIATGQCGTPAQSADAVVQLDPAIPTAANDICSTATPVGMGTNVLGAGQNPCGAMVTENGGFTFCSTSLTSKADLWYAFTPTTSGNYRIETCGSNVDTILSLYEVCNGSETVCNDNYTTGASSGCSSNRSRINSTAMNADQTYYIRISTATGTFLSASSIFNLSIINAPAAAANDECATATVAIPGVNAFDTNEATISPGEFPSCGSVDTRDVFFTFTAPGNGKATFKTCPGTTWNTLMSVRDGCFGAEYACNDNASISGCSQQSIISNLAMTNGQTVTIRIGGNTATAFGVGQLTIDFRCQGDIDGDGDVDSDDIIMYFGAWDSGDAAIADMDGDDDTDSDDLVIFFGSFDAGC